MDTVAEMILNGEYEHEYEFWVLLNKIHRGYFEYRSVPQQKGKRY